MCYLNVIEDIKIIHSMEVTRRYNRIFKNNSHIMISNLHAITLLDLTVLKKNKFI
jgi:hypothetical protein